MKVLPSHGVNPIMALRLPGRLRGAASDMTLRGDDERPIRHLTPWHPAFLIATWFGAGLLPRVPGTWGSLAALPVAWIIVLAGGWTALAAAAALLFLLGWWASAAYVDALQLDDPGAIVVDEVVGQWLVLLVVPHDILLYLLAFILFRVADIAKPWPARWADRYVKEDSA